MAASFGLIQHNSIIKQYYPRGCSLTSFEHDSDAVSAEVRKHHWSAQTTLKKTLEGNIAIIQQLPTK